MSTLSTYKKSIDVFFQNDDTNEEKKESEFLHSFTFLTKTILFVDCDSDGGSDALPLLHLPGGAGQVPVPVAGLLLVVHQEHVRLHQAGGEHGPGPALTQPLLHHQ